jgi:signal transduction histidine kinase
VAALRARSLRLRLTALATAVIAVVLTAATLLLVHEVGSSLLASLDASARSAARAAAAAVAAGDLRAAVDVATDDDTVVQVVDASRQVVASTPDAAGRPLLFGFGSAKPASMHDTGVLRVPGGADSYRVAALSLANGGAVYVAIASDDFRSTVDELTSVTQIGLPVVVVLIAAITWWLVGSALGPVEQLRGQAAAVGAHAEDQRLSLPATYELRRLAATFNDLLDRVHRSHERQREFVADAAHELRSPLAALRTQLEVGDAGLSGGSAEQRRTLLAEVDRMSRLTDDQLSLARIDGAAPTSARSVDLDELVLDELRRWRSGAQVAVDASGVSAARTRGDAEALRRVVRNLLDNAGRHATTRVTVRLVADAAGCCLTVSDDGPGVRPEDRGRIFDRFTRLDDARGRSAGGFGLGLAIVREVARAHSGEVTIEGDPPGATFVVRLPAAD